MFRKESEAVSEGSGPVPQQEVFGPNQPTLEEVCRMIKEVFEEWDRRIDNMREYTEERRSMNQRLTRLEHDARQPRLAIEADRPANTKTRERTKGAAKAVQAKHGDSCTVQRFQEGSKTSTCFGVMAKPSALSCREGVLVGNGAAAPKSCLPFLEMCSPAAAGGLLLTGEASIATMTTYNQPPLRLPSTKEMNSKKTNSRTPVLYVSYDSSF